MFDIHSTPVAAFIVSVDGNTFRVSDVNAEWVRWSGVPADHLLGKSPTERFAAPLAETLLAKYRLCAHSRQPVSYEVESAPSGGDGCRRTTLVPMVSPDGGQVTALVGICVDTTADKIAERARNSVHDKLSLAIGNLDGGFWIYDIFSGEFETSHPLAELLAGPGHTTLNLAQYVNYVHSEDLVVASPVRVEGSVEYRVITHDKRQRWFQSKRRNIRNDKGIVTHVVGLVIDITDEKCRRHILETEATTDELTGLKNRRGLERLAFDVFRKAAEGEPVALLLIDLDGFKPVNDTYGHLAGDDILRTVARRLRRLAAPEDVVARIGGDEFAMLAKGGPSALARIQDRLSYAFDRPFRCEKRVVRVGASVGTALQDPADRTLADLIDRADKALYAVKKSRHLLNA